MQETISNNKRIAKNTLMLYIRMVLSVVVSLYTSRVVLEVLGVEDYGIYGVVGGVVAMFSFLNSSMSGATSRFLTYELGQGNSERLKNTFSSAIIIHLAIAVMVLILAETIGLWFLTHKLVIPDGRMDAAHWVYQCSIFSAMLTITQVPYNSLIIAHERMGVYAYIEILNVVLKLLIVYLLMICNFDKLKLYAILFLGVTVVIMLICRVYCIRKFSEARFSLKWKKELALPMLSFTSWDFYGNMCATVRQQGNNFLINTFIGVAANASASIAMTVNVIVGGFASNIITAFRPRIIKNYSQKQWKEMQDMINSAIKYTLLFFIFLAIPLFFETSIVLKIWLGNVPQYAESFIRLILIANGLGVVNTVIVIGIHATGNIKRLSFLTGTFYLLSIPIAYVFLRYGYSANIVYVVYALSNLVIVGINLWILRQEIAEIRVLQILREVILVILVALLSAGLIYPIYNNLESGLLRLILITICDLIIFPSIAYIISLNSEQRAIVRKILSRKFTINNGK